MVIATLSRLGALALSRSQILEDAITETLQRLRMDPFPTNPQDPWRINWDRYNQIISGVRDYVNDILEVKELSPYTSEAIAVAVTARGYTGSVPKAELISWPTVRIPDGQVTILPVDPFVPVVSEPAPVVQEPQPSATVRTGTITREAPSTEPVVTPITLPYRPPVPSLPEAVPGTEIPRRPFPTWILFALLGFIVLSREDKPRRRRGSSVFAATWR